MFKIDKTLVDNMNMNKSCIVITHKETAKQRPPVQEKISLEEDAELPKAIQEKAKNFVQNANAKAQQIISQAMAEADQLKETARQQGLNEGLMQAADEHKKQLNQLQKAIANVETYKESLFDALQDEVLGLSLDIAEKVINTELEKDDTAYRELVIKAVNSLKRSDHFTLYVSKSEYERFFKDAAPWLKAETECGEYETVIDHGLESGDCIIESDNELIDAGVSTQLGKIKKHLSEQVEA